jgi:hypothetical protein
LAQSDSQFFQNAKTRWHEPVPYWDAVMLSIMNSPEIPENVLQLASFNHPISETQFSVKARELRPEKIKALIEENPDADPLAICSEVKLAGGETRHIPMMDFRCPRTDQSLSLVCKVAALFKIGRGYVIETDRSYHFYGAELLTASELTAFLGRALLFSPIVDRTWIAHQLIDMSCNLRVAPLLANGELRRIVALVN